MIRPAGIRIQSMRSPITEHEMPHPGETMGNSIEEL